MVSVESADPQSRTDSLASFIRETLVSVESADPQSRTLVAKLQDELTVSVESADPRTAVFHGGCFKFYVTHQEMASYDEHRRKNAISVHPNYLPVYPTDDRKTVL